MDNVQKALCREFFPQDRESLNAQYPKGEGVGMTRQEHIDRAVLLLNGVMVGRRIYTALYPDGEPWDDLIGRLKPWLRDDASFAEWWALEPFDRFQQMTGGNL